MSEEKGLVKTSWAEIRKRVLKIEPKLTKLIDELDPGKDFPLYLAHYPYGALIADTQTTFIPKEDKTFYRLNDPSAPKNIIRDLGYAKEATPLALILEKNIESFIDAKSESICVPWRIYKPGEFFSFSRVLVKKSKYVHYSNNILSASSGVRSTFMLPYIECATHHANLQRDFNVSCAAPKTLYEHWEVFREIANSPHAECSWSSCLLFFSESWINKIYNDARWSRLRLYLQELAWKRFEYQRNSVYYNIAFSVIQKKRNLKPNPYLADTVQHLFGVALGEIPGYAPATEEESLPLGLLQKAYVESYGLTKYFPTIIEAAYFDFREDTRPIYYSLQNPSTFVSSPKSRKNSSILSELREIARIIKKYKEELTNGHGMCTDTVISQVAKHVEFKYFHNEHDRHHVVNSSQLMLDADRRFNFVDPKVPKRYMERFASDARFVRGCIRIGKET